MIHLIRNYSGRNRIVPVLYDNGTKNCNILAYTYSEAGSTATTSDTGTTLDSTAYVDIGTPGGLIGVNAGWYFGLNQLFNVRPFTTLNILYNLTKIGSASTEGNLTVLYINYNSYTYTYGTNLTKTITLNKLKPCRDGLRIYTSRTATATTYNQGATLVIKKVWYA